MMNSESTRSPTPSVTVLVLSWNSIAHLSRCMDCLTKQSIIGFEVVVIDNGSTDGSETILTNGWDGLDLRSEKLNINKGFATANNLGARSARGEWLVLLNADAYPEPDWLENLLSAAQANPGYTAFSSRQIQFNAPDLLDGAGDSYHITGLAWRRFYNKPIQGYGEKVEEVFSACPAAALYLRDDFLEVGGFDGDYFSYFEDVDLGFRLRLAGKKCLYVPNAVVHHVGSASTRKRSDFSVYYGYRNMIWTFFKNMPSPLFWFLLPLHVVTLLFFVVYLSMRGQAKIILKAIWDAIRDLPKVMKKRKMIQSNRKVKASELLRVMSMGLLEPYREFAQRNKRR